MLFAYNQFYLLNTGCLCLPKRLTLNCFNLKIYDGTKREPAIAADHKISIVFIKSHAALQIISLTPFNRSSPGQQCLIT